MSRPAFTEAEYRARICGELLEYIEDIKLFMECEDELPTVDKDWAWSDLLRRRKRIKAMHCRILARFGRARQ